MTPEHVLLAASIDDAVRAVAGVTAVYSASPVAVQTARAAITGGGAPLSAISSTETGLSVVVSVGVTPSVQAPVTALSVARAVREMIGGTVDADVSVRISRITD
jgi:hypothetical protein